MERKDEVTSGKVWVSVVLQNMEERKREGKRSLREGWKEVHRLGGSRDEGPTEGTSGSRPITEKKRGSRGTRKDTGLIKGQTSSINKTPVEG